jgi:hypothetical protein
VDVGPPPLEKVGVSSRLMKDSFKKLLFLIFASVLTGTMLVACASKFLKYEKSEQLKKNEEFEKRVQIVEVPPPPTAPPPQVGPDGKPIGSSEPLVTQPEVKPEPPKKVKVKKGQKTVEVPAPPVEPQKRQPEIESDLGFDGRRPLKDPFRVGEKVTHSVNYFKMQAGTLILETRPYAMVNGVKNYQFRTTINTSSLFSSFYSVDDHVDVLMDFAQMIPSVFTLHVKETSQLKEAQMFFDQQKGVATYWEKKVTDKSGEETKKLQWDILPYAQNVFSAAFYMRVFQWEVGKENAFHVADDEKNLIFRAKAIRREKISTEAGDFNAIVIRPEIELKGKYNPVGDNYIWLSDDDRKYILRIESKIKIGTLVSEVTQIIPGH